MGNNSRSPEDYDLVSKYRQQQWLQDRTNQGTRICRNKRTRQAVQVLRLHDIPSIEDMDTYTFRMMENDLIRVHHLVIDTNSDLCAINHFAHLLVEYIPIRLNNIRNFDREEALTILSAAFRAFHLIQIKFGQIQPHEELIGFNEQGKTKIWLNRNPIINQVEKRYNDETPSKQSTVGDRVKLLFEMIQQRTRYVLLPPIIKEEIYHPFTTYLSALKVLEKFAYYQKLNLRKYLQFGHQRQPILPTPSPQSRHERRSSNFTEYKQSHQICCDRNQSSFCESAIKQPQFRRIYSVNSIHNPSNNSSFQSPVFQQPVVRGERQFLVKHSIMSNSSQQESVRPSSVYFTHSVPASQSVEQVRSSYLREGPIVSKTLQTTLENVPKAEVDEQENVENKQQIQGKVSQHSKEQQKIAEVTKENEEIKHPQSLNSLSDRQPPSLQHQQFSIIDRINDFINEQSKINEQIDLQKENSNLQPNSPTFVRIIQPKNDILSFAPSQNNLQQSHPVKEIKKSEEQEDQQRRLSIENKSHKLEFALNLNPGSILNYCTAVQSKLHMATNREHSIIDKKPEQLAPKAEDERIEQYIREKYGVHEAETKPEIPHRFKVERVASKYTTVPKNPQTHIPKQTTQHRFETSLNRFENTEDFLDVNFLEKSLDKRYNIENQIRINEKRREIQENDVLNIARLEEGLQKFSKSQLSQKNTEQHIKSKESIPKKQESSYDILLQGHPQNSFQNYYPFKEKKTNERQHGYVSPNESDYLRKNEKRSSKYFQGVKQTDYYNECQDNKHEYSFQGTNKSLYGDSSRPIPTPKASIKQTLGDSKPIQAKSRKRLQDYSEQPAAKTSSPTRRISYNELRQFLWN